MNISAKTEYACLAVLELAARFGSPQPLRIQDIADKHGIPSRFLVQILLQLKGAGIVSSTRGASGGYRLARKPEEISLFQVMHVIDGFQEIASNLKESSASARVLNQVWNSVSKNNRELLEKVTIQELVDRSQSDSEEMYYI